jgi:hypothetical protein
MKTQHVVGSGIAIVVLIIAVERWYEHPTYGRGVTALYAAARAAIVLSG